ncbi:thiamine phosphate synthase [Methylorubrum extorquens]|uniref:Thiamine-phosphate synthase n=1 Tax=Methylorubrum extorquens TaxID=408 RepID=A0AAX3WH04_METEX|nr:MULTISPECIES: thiamine phosphate synthase [Methylobacteriaceae]KQO89330.1 thiamine monophosphate synthase [Methylobacterium sp. Leaf92]KQQ23969.1 thiamine monophosphate synthase [Methylobacterium sp. Leaf122]WHQ70651.1 thiamine phosphate synthase [Methylorubrum extorquens]
MTLPPLLVVTDRHGAARPLTETVGAAVVGGARFVWLRDRDLDRDARRDLARDLIALLEPAGGRLVVGGDADLAAEIGAQGVHLPGSGGIESIRAARTALGAAALIGFSAHSVAEIAAAAAAGADYATLSPIFPTASKPGYGPALGLDSLHAAAAYGVPVFALGGIDWGNARACREAGAAGVAVMGGVMRGSDPHDATGRFVAALT